MSTGPRDTATRIADTRRHLESDADLWLATAPANGGAPGLVPLSFEWDGETLLLATERRSPAGTNLRETGRCRAALGGLRDVVMVEADATEVEMDGVDGGRWRRYAERTGWDPRESGPAYVAYLLHPTTIQAWREVDEIPGRTVLRDGRWVDAP